MASPAVDTPAPPAVPEVDRGCVVRISCDAKEDDAAELERNPKLLVRLTHILGDWRWLFRDPSDVWLRVLSPDELKEALNPAAAAAAADAARRRVPVRNRPQKRQRR